MGYNEATHGPYTDSPAPLDSDIKSCPPPSTPTPLSLPPAPQGPSFALLLVHRLGARGRGVGVGGRVGKGLTAATATVSVKSCCLLAASAIIIPAAERHHEAISFRSPRASPKMSAFRTNRLPPFASQCPGRSKKIKIKIRTYWSIHRTPGHSTVSLSFHRALVVPPCLCRFIVP